MNETEKEKKTGWSRHPVDIRLSLPFITNRYYLTLVAGRERRCPDRRSEDRAKHALGTSSNLMFLLSALAWLGLFGWVLAQIPGIIMEGLKF